MHKSTRCEPTKPAPPIMKTLFINDIISDMVVLMLHQHEYSNVLESYSIATFTQFEIALNCMMPEKIQDEMTGTILDYF